MRAIAQHSRAPTGWSVSVTGELIGQFNVAGLFNLLSIESSAEAEGARVYTPAFGIDIAVGEVAQTQFKLYNRALASLQCKFVELLQLFNRTFNLAVQL